MDRYRFRCKYCKWSGNIKHSGEHSGRFWTRNNFCSTAKLYRKNGYSHVEYHGNSFAQQQSFWTFKCLRRNGRDSLQHFTCSRRIIIKHMVCKRSNYNSFLYTIFLYAEFWCRIYKGYFVRDKFKCLRIFHKKIHHRLQARTARFNKWLFR